MTTAADSTGEFLRHTVVQGERWDLLAWTYYADATRYEAILRANPDLRDGLGQWPTVPPMGAIVLIPVLNMPAAATVEGLPPWVH